MRNAADDIDTEIEGALELRGSAGRAKIPVLRKRDELQIEIGLDLALYRDERLDGEETGIADVDMAADGEKPLGDRPVAISERTRRYRFDRQHRLQLAPERDALEQGAGAVHPRQPEAQTRIHMEMRIDERCRDQEALHVELTRCGSGEPRL